MPGIEPRASQRHVQNSPIKPHPWVPYLAFLYHVCTEQHEHVRPHLLQKSELQQSHLSNGPLTCSALLVWPCVRPQRPSRAESSQGPKGCTERPHGPNLHLTTLCTLMEGLQWCRWCHGQYCCQDVPWAQGLTVMGCHWQGTTGHRVLGLQK